MKNILLIGSADPPYHPLSNLTVLKESLCDYNLTFTEDDEMFLNLNGFSMLLCYCDVWGRPLNDLYAIALNAYLKDGGKILSIHNGISLQDTPKLFDISGARFTHHPKHGELTIKPVVGHPITQGLQDFCVNDEPYHYEMLKTVRILANYDYDGKTIPAAWEYTHENGTLIYLMPGHDEKVFKCKHYQQLIRNSVVYLIGKPL